MASNPKPYDIFQINNYTDYLEAMEKSTTEMFWGYNNQIIINKDFMDMLWKFIYFILRF